MIDASYFRNMAVRARAGCFQVLFLLPVLMAGFGLITLTGPVMAQSFTTLLDYGATGLVLSGNTLYGIWGGVFALNVNGTGYTALHSFSLDGSDGNEPTDLIVSGTTLYGTTRWGGSPGSVTVFKSSGSGTVFTLNTDGTGFTTLYGFSATSTNSSGDYTNSDGAHPSAGLVLSGNTLYGAASEGGSWGYGTVFSVNTDGTGFTTLYSFTGGSDGAGPDNLILSGNTLYGTALTGEGTSFNGTVFRLNTDGTGFRTLHIFTATPDPLHHNLDGAGPYRGLILSGNTLYGATARGGSSGYGTVFAVNTDGTGFTAMHSFNGLSDGLNPGNLILSGNTLYGTSGGGGGTGHGNVFAVNTDGAGFTIVYSFTANDPLALILSGNTLYGAAGEGGSTGNGGTVFSISLPVNPPQLAITPSGGNAILAWATNAIAFTLQSTTNLGSSAIWTSNLPAPVVVNGQNTVTNPISGTQQFFRLSQ